MSIREIDIGRPDREEGMEGGSCIITLDISQIRLDPWGGTAWA